MQYQQTCHRRLIFRWHVLKVTPHERRMTLRNQVIPYLSSFINYLSDYYNSSYWIPRAQTLSPRISERCPSFCTVYVVSKGKLASVRPSDPEALSCTKDETIDTSRFSNFSSSYTNNSQSGTVYQSILY